MEETDKSPAPLLPPADGARYARDLVALADIAYNLITSFEYPSSPRTLTMVTVPALRRYCSTAYGV